VNVVVYTALFGDIDPLWSATPGKSRYPHIVFTEQRRQEVGVWHGNPPVLSNPTAKAAARWEQRLVDANGDARVLARHYKLLPHRYLPDADVWVWIDANVRMRVLPENVVLEWLGDADFATLKHPVRDCAYHEARECERLGKARPEVLAVQAGAYRAAGLPEHWGLAETRIVIRRNTPEIVALNEAWWDELRRHSARDQIALPFVCWQAGLRWRVIPGHVIGARHPQIWNSKHIHIQT